MSSNNIGRLSPTTSSGSNNRSMQTFLAQTPLLVLVLLVINVIIHIWVFLTTMDISPFVFQPYRVWYLNQYYRMITSAFLHGGIMHIGMNMMSLIAIGGMLEPVYGTFKFLCLTWLSILLGGLCYLILAFITAWFTNDWSYIGVSSIGYSGVLFSYAVIESFHSPESSRSIFGMFSVPTKLYPFILLVIIQVILPNISLFGHLGGLLAGIILMTSVGHQLLVPSQETMEWLETKLVPGVVRGWSCYRPITTKEMIHPSLAGGDVRSIIIGIGTFLFAAITCMLNILVTIFHIFGIPLDRYVQSCTDGLRDLGGRLYVGCCGCLESATTTSSSVAENVSSLVSNPMARSQGYETVPTSSIHGNDVEMGDQRSTDRDRSDNASSHAPFNKPGNRLGGNGRSSGRGGGGASTTGSHSRR